MTEAVDPGQYEAEVEAAYAERDALLADQANTAMDQMRDQAAAENRYFTPQELAQFHSHAAQAATWSSQQLEQHGPDYFKNHQFVGVARHDGPYTQQLSTQEIREYAAELQDLVASGWGWEVNGWASGQVPADEDGRAR